MLFKDFMEKKHPDVDVKGACLPSYVNEYLVSSDVDDNLKWVVENGAKCYNNAMTNDDRQPNGSSIFLNKNDTSIVKHVTRHIGHDATVSEIITVVDHVVEKCAFLSEHANKDIDDATFCSTFKSNIPSYVIDTKGKPDRVFRLLKTVGLIDAPASTHTNNTLTVIRSAPKLDAPDYPRVCDDFQNVSYALQKIDGAVVKDGLTFKVKVGPAFKIARDMDFTDINTVKADLENVYAFRDAFGDALIKADENIKAIDAEIATLSAKIDRLKALKGDNERAMHDLCIMPNDYAVLCAMYDGLTAYKAVELMREMGVIDADKVDTVLKEIENKDFYTDVMPDGNKKEYPVIYIDVPSEQTTDEQTTDGDTKTE